MNKIILLILCFIINTACRKKPIADEEAAIIETPTISTKTDPDSVWAITGTGPHLIFKFKFDSTQVRLDNIGNPSAPIPAGRWAYSPVFNKMASHYIELAKQDTTSFKHGTILYYAPETTLGGSNAIDFSKSTVVREGETFFAIPLSSLTPGDSFKWLRLSLSYQNYNIPYKANGIYGNGTVASFLGFNTYVPKYKIKTQYMVPSNALPVGGPNVNHPQGYWGFETFITGFGYSKLDGQSQSATTTVVNANQLSQIPAGTCVVTAQFRDATGALMNFTVPAAGTQTTNIVIEVSLSTNKSFEFTDVDNNKIYEPGPEQPVDMGIRGMIPKVTY